MLLILMKYDYEYESSNLPNRKQLLNGPQESQLSLTDRASPDFSGVTQPLGSLRHFLRSGPL